jgi:dTDP-4-amino-4,6-dideoxy-D-galactose acyltransferase
MYKLKKLFVFPEADNLYLDELSCAREQLGSEIFSIPAQDLTIAFLEETDIAVLISTGLSKQWYYTLKGMGIVTITFGERNSYYGMSDIVIDCKHNNPKRYFVNPENSVCNNRDFNFDYIVSLISKLEWDSTFFGYNVALISCMHLTENIYKYIEKFIQDENIRLVEYLCNCHDATSVQVAENKGFRFTDIRLTFSRVLVGDEAAELPENIRFEKADENAVPALRQIAKGLYADSRYCFDNNFDLIKIDEFYQGWVEKGVLGQYDDEAWCLFENHEPFAFCTLRFRKENTASIGLVGIKENYCGRGFGRKLLLNVFDHLYRRDVQSVIVVTQGRNYAAQNLYQSVGFRTKITQLWYHKWI